MGDCLGDRLGDCLGTVWGMISPWQGSLGVGGRRGARGILRTTTTSPNSLGSPPVESRVDRLATGCGRRLLEGKSALPLVAVI